jgi:hypothetical protein
MVPPNAVSNKGDKLMRTSRVLAVVATVAIVFGLTGAATAGTTYEGRFVLHFGRGGGASNSPCPNDSFCGVGTLAGFGPATSTLDFTSFEEIEETPCLAVTLTETITPLDGSGTLVLEEAGVFCSPGGSDGAPLPPANQSYGHPHTMETTYTVDPDASTGVFAGATGSGSTSFVSAGDVAAWGPSR